MGKKLNLNLRKSKLPTFSEMVGFDLQLGNHTVVLTLKKPRRITWTPFPLLCAAFLIRNGLSYATMHNVPCRWVTDREGRLVAYIVYIGDGFEQYKNGEYGSTDYLRSIGFGQPFLDFREDIFRQSALNSPGMTGSLRREVEEWKYRTIPHSDARNN